MRLYALREEVYRVLENISPNFGMVTDDHVHLSIRYRNPDDMMESLYSLITIEPERLEFVKSDNKQVKEIIKKRIPLSDRHYLQSLFQRYNAQTMEEQGSERFYIVLPDESLAISKHHFYVYDHKREKWVTRLTYAEESKIQFTFLKEELEEMLNPFQQAHLEIRSVNSDEFRAYEDQKNRNKESEKKYMERVRKEGGYDADFM